MLVRVLDRHLRDTTDHANVAGRSCLLVQVACHVNACCRDRDRRFAGQGTKLFGLLGQIHGCLLDLHGESQVGTETSHEIFRGHGLDLGLLEGLVQDLEATANLFLGHLGQGTNFLEGTWDTLLTTGNKDASRNDALVGFAPQQLIIFNTLEQLLGDIG